MNFTFGIITDGNNEGYINTVIASIHRQAIPSDKYEIIIVGNSRASGENVRVIPFDDNIKRAWITRKKNIVTEQAKFENVVYTHDYISFSDGWYTGFCNYGNNFLACMTPMINSDGTRFRDWTTFPPWVRPLGVNTYMLPYNVTNLSKHQYFSGAYFICKRHIMQEIPLDESLCWGEGEDVVWSKAYNSKYEFKINTQSTVKLIKYKPAYFEHITPEDLSKLM